MSRFDSAVIVGASRSGKTTLIKDMLYHAHVTHQIPQIKVYSKTEKYNKNFENIVPAAAIEGLMTKERVEDFVNQTQAEVEKAVLTNPKRLAAGYYDRLLLSDDAIAGNNVLNSNVFEEVFLHGRHFRITPWIASQQANKIPRFARTNAAYAFLFFTGSESDQEFLFKNLVTHVRPFSLFRELMETYCQDYTCLVFHRECKLNKMENAVFYYKARAPPDDFQFGNRSWRAAAERLVRVIPPLMPPPPMPTIKDKKSNVNKTITLNAQYVEDREQQRIRKADKEERIKREEDEFLQTALQGLMKHSESQEQSDIMFLDAEFL